MGYDADVIVVGGGPAGLAAAIRCRWVKGYKAVPCSTLLIENAELGGLAGWQGCMLTGPGWKFSRDEIVTRMTRDLRRFHIPVHTGRVVRIDAAGTVKKVFTAEGKVLRSLAVVVATGIKVLTNERSFFGKGLAVTSMGYEHIAGQLKSLLDRPWPRPLVVVGSPKLSNLIPLLQRLKREAGRSDSELVFVVEGAHGDPRPADVVSGWVVRYEGREQLEAVVVETADGTRRRIDCGGALLDFNSYEIAPQCRLDIPVLKSDSDFIATDADMRTGIPGVFAAGDVTAGGYNSFSRAVSQGVAAGLSAYADLFEIKFGCRPPLFAYRPQDFELTADFRELPPLTENLRPYALAPASEIEPLFGSGVRSLPVALDGSKTLKDLGRELKIPLPELEQRMRLLVEQKLITFHVEVSQ